MQGFAELEKDEIASYFEDQMIKQFNQIPQIIDMYGITFVFYLNHNKHVIDIYKLNEIYYVNYLILYNNLLIKTPNYYRKKFNTINQVYNYIDYIFFTLRPKTIY